MLIKLTLWFKYKSKSIVFNDLLFQSWWLNLFKLCKRHHFCCKHVCVYAEIYKASDHGRPLPANDSAAAGMYRALYHGRDTGRGKPLVIYFLDLSQILGFTSSLSFMKKGEHLMMFVAEFRAGTIRFIISSDVLFKEQDRILHTCNFVLFMWSVGIVRHVKGISLLLRNWICGLCQKFWSSI